jgi:hypothetical protein
VAIKQQCSTSISIAKLQFATSKCFKLHVGQTVDEALCRDLFVDGWKIDLVEDAETGKLEQIESFAAPELMSEKDEDFTLEM